MQWNENVVENVIADTPAQGYAFGLVEFPVDAEIDAALAVLLPRLGRERRNCVEAGDGYCQCCPE